MKNLMMISFFLMHGAMHCSSSKQNFTSNQITRAGYEAVNCGQEIEGVLLIQKGNQYDKFKNHKDFGKLVAAVIAGNEKAEIQLVFQCMNEQN